MKAKKLTKREWYWAALAWEASARLEPFNDKGRQEIMCEAGDAAVGETGGYNNGNTPKGSCDRWFMYSQYCLERAGIPAGDR